MTTEEILEVQNEIGERRAHLNENIEAVRFMKDAGLDVTRCMSVIREDRRRLQKMLARLDRELRFATC